MPAFGITAHTSGRPGQPQEATSSPGNSGGKWENNIGKLPALDRFPSKILQDLQAPSKPRSPTPLQGEPQRQDPISQVPKKGD